MYERTWLFGDRLDGLEIGVAVLRSFQDGLLAEKVEDALDHLLGIFGSRRPVRTFYVHAAKQKMEHDSS